MEDETKSEEAVQPGKRERSASYPSDTVLKSYKFASEINEIFSAVSQVTREEIALARKTHPNTISREIAACVQYGFLKKGQSDNRYQLTKLFSDIFRPESEREKKQNLIIAFGNPKLNKELIEKFDNNIIPAEFKNTLIKHHGITEGASEAASEVFINSAQEVGVLYDGRILKYSVTLSTVQKTQYAEIIEEIPKKSEINSNNEYNNSLIVVQNSPSSQKQNIDVPIYLTGSKKAILVYPSDINKKDIKLLEHAIQGVLLRLELNSEEDKEKELNNKGDESPS